MKTVKEIHNLYDVYCFEMEAIGDKPLDYDEFLEVLVIQSDCENEMLLSELSNYQQAAETTHVYWSIERDKREALDCMLETVRFMLNHGQYQKALQFVGAMSAWN